MANTQAAQGEFYSHVNYSVTKIVPYSAIKSQTFYSHVNYSVTKIPSAREASPWSFTVT